MIRLIDITTAAWRVTRRILASEWLQWTVVGTGVLLRLIAYLDNRSLWRDEALLATNIESRSYADLFLPLDNQQAAPVGFLFVERFVVQVLGTSEYALRLVPLLAGLASMFLFRTVSKRTLHPVVVPVALGLFAISNKLVYYSSEVKQYSTDVAISLALLLAAISIGEAAGSWLRAALFAVFGALAIWFSHPSVFVLAGIGGSLLLLYLWTRTRQDAGLLVLPASIWVVSFVVSYLAVLRETSRSSFLLTFWEGYGGFLPADASLLSHAGWLLKAILNAFENPAGFTLPALAALAFLLGCGSAVYYKRFNLLMLAASIPFVLLASALREYPFLDRLLLFLIPVFLLLIAEGIQLAGRRTAVLGALLAVVLSLHPIINTVQNPLGDQGREDIKPALAYVRARWQEGDIVYVHYAIKRLFKYYAGRQGFTEDDYFKGVKRPEETAQFGRDLEQLSANKRVWVLFLVRNERTARELELFAEQSARMGEIIDSFEASGISVFLYDFENKSRAYDWRKACLGGRGSEPAAPAREISLHRGG